MRRGDRRWSLRSDLPDPGPSRDRRLEAGITVAALFRRLRHWHGDTVLVLVQQQQQQLLLLLLLLRQKHSMFSMLNRRPGWLDFSCSWISIATEIVCLESTRRSRDECLPISVCGNDPIKASSYRSCRALAVRVYSGISASATTTNAEPGLLLRSCSRKLRLLVNL